MYNENRVTSLAVKFNVNFATGRRRQARKGREEIEKVADEKKKKEDDEDV
jgi:hypothetical protein